MDLQLSDFASWTLPLLIIGLGYLAGWIFKKIIHVRIKKLVNKTDWKLDDIVLKAIESQINIWFIIVAFFIAMPRMDLDDVYLNYLERGIDAVLILSITLAVNHLVIGFMLLWSNKQNKSFPSTAIFSNLIRIIIVTIGVIIVLDSWGMSIAPFLTALGIGGLAISLALKDTLSDLFSGLHILLSEKVKPGDFVELDSGHTGHVMNITWRNTTLLERTNNVISIPNARLSTAILKNYDAKDPSFSLKINLGVSYDSDLELVEKVTIEEAKRVISESDEAIKDYGPIVRFKLFADSSINFAIYLRVKRYGDQHSLTHELIKAITKRYRKEGINIPFPIRTLHHKNEIS